MRMSKTAIAPENDAQLQLCLLVPTFKDIADLLLKPWENKISFKLYGNTVSCQTRVLTLNNN